MLVFTNRPLGPGLQERCSQTLDANDIEEWDYVGPGPDGAKDNADSLIVVDKRSIGEAYGGN